MGDLSCYTGPTPIYSVNLTNAAVTRGLRLTFDSTGNYSAAAIGVRGDRVAANAGAASQQGLAAFPIQNGMIVPMQSDGTATIAVGDTIYSAAAGQVSETATNAVLIGKANQACAPTAGLIFEVLVENPL